MSVEKIGPNTRPAIGMNTTAMVRLRQTTRYDTSAIEGGADNQDDQSRLDAGKGDRGRQTTEHVHQPETGQPA